jgi:hypothetical protein
MTSAAPDGGPTPTLTPEPAPGSPAGRSATTRRLLLLVIVGALVLLFASVFGGDLGRIQAGIGEPGGIYATPSQSAGPPS